VTPLIQVILLHLEKFATPQLFICTKRAFLVFGGLNNHENQRVFYTELLSALIRVHIGKPDTLISSLSIYQFLCSGGLLEDGELTTLFSLFLDYLPHQQSSQYSFDASPVVRVLSLFIASSRSSHHTCQMVQAAVINSRFVPRILCSVVQTRVPWVSILNLILVEWSWQIPIDSEVISGLASFWSIVDRPDFRSVEILLKIISSCPDPQLIIASDLLPLLLVSEHPSNWQTIRNVMCLVEISLNPHLGKVFSHLLDLDLLPCLMSLLHQFLSSQLPQTMTKSDLDQIDVESKKKKLKQLPVGKMVDVILKAMNSDEKYFLVVKGLSLTPQTQLLLFETSKNSKKKRIEPSVTELLPSPEEQGVVSPLTRSEKAIGQSSKKSRTNE
jgi:hypothetical protein